LVPFKGCISAFLVRIDVFAVDVHVRGRERSERDGRGAGGRGERS